MIANFVFLFQQIYFTVLNKRCNMFVKGELPLLGILRGISEEHINALVDICKKTGIKYLEVTMNTSDAGQLIRKMIQTAGDEIHIGAGTVRDKKELDEALLAGAEFIVSPSLIEEVVVTCVKEHVPVFPGALTPTEIHKSWSMGATMVKLFPAGLFGPGYIGMLKAPFNSVRIMVTGGVNEQNIAEYFRQGADAAAFGAGIFRMEWLKARKYDMIEEHLVALIQAYRGEILV
jgi:2-dehydro-3-deoxyphosphogluconate aldolase/(4S)-4-hydroxy-2-oxoglutarate aldolase